MASDPFDYIESRADADELISDFGGVATIVHDVASGTAWAPTLTPTSFATFAVRVEFTWRQLQDESVLSSDQRWLVAAGPLDVLGLAVVLPSDRISVGGVEMSIIKADPLRPAGVNVMYDCQVRV